MSAKRGQINSALFLGAVITVIAVAIAVVVGQSILANVGAGFSANTFEANSSRDARNALGQLTTQLPNIALVVILVIIISLLTAAFFFFKGR